MIQVKLLYFITSLLSFNCLIIGFHNNRAHGKLAGVIPTGALTVAKLPLTKQVVWGGHSEQMAII